MFTTKICNFLNCLFILDISNLHLLNVLFELTIFKMTVRDRIVVREIDVRALVRMLQNHPKSIRLFEHSWQAHGQAISYSQKVCDKSDIMFVSKNIVRTSMRNDVFGTFAQMKHSALRRSCLN
jgi:hypothetical protein